MRSFRYHKYLPMACIVFFINSLDFFPHGLLITTMLSPFFYVWLLLKRYSFVLEIFLLVLFPFALANLFSGMNKSDFIVAFLLLLTTYVTVYAFAVAIRETHSLDQVIRTLIWLNLGFAFLGLLVRFTPWYGLMWQIPGENGDYSTLIRFRGFTYEPSHYCTLLMPLLLYAYWSFAQHRSRYTFGLLAATVFPLFMSLSFGSIGAVIVSVFIVHFIRGRSQTRFKWILGITIALAGVYFALPATSTIKQRIDNIATGNDSSTNVRTTEAYVSSFAMAWSKDIWFGVGLGEAKDYGAFFMSQTQSVLPAAVADTFAELGLVGLLLRFGLEIYFFIKTRPDRDPYRFSLFLWVFIFQFGASYKYNVAEYVVWIMAFSPSVGFFSKREDEHEDAPSANVIPQLT